MTSDDRALAGGDPVNSLAARFGLPGAAVASLRCLLDTLASDPLAPTSVREPAQILDDHLADSLVALSVPQLPRAGRAVDIGAGAGLPGLALAIALPEVGFTLLDSSFRKCRFMAEVIRRCGLANATVAHARAEAWSEGIGGFDLATARALAPLPVLLEYAAPLLRVDGVLLAWRGRRDDAAEQAAATAGEELGLRPGAVRQVRPYPGAEHRHLHLWSKVRETPAGFPRRPGVALKRPLGGARTGI